MGKKANPNTCEFCPNKYAKGCPHWIKADSGFMETNAATGEIRPVTGCFFQVIPRLMAHVVAEARRPAAVLQGLRNDMVDGMRTIVSVVANSPALAAPKVVGPLLEHKEDGEK